MRETEGYRKILEELHARSGGAMIMSAKQVGEYLGIDYRTAQRRYNITRAGIATPKLAMMLAKQ